MHVFSVRAHISYVCLCSLRMYEYTSARSVSPKGTRAFCLLRASCRPSCCNQPGPSVNSIGAAGELQQTLNKRRISTTNAHLWVCTQPQDANAVHMRVAIHNEVPEQRPVKTPWAAWSRDPNTPAYCIAKTPTKQAGPNTRTNKRPPTPKHTTLFSRQTPVH